MSYDVLVIGAGLSGLTAASLLARRNLRVAVIEQGERPGGACGVFKRRHVTFDQGSAMLYGFGENGFNAHRFVFNCLEEPIDVIRHDLLYHVVFKGRTIRFWADIDQFVEELSGVFPGEAPNIKRFYHDMHRIYRHVMVDTPSYTTADETPATNALHGMLRHPVSYIRFLSFLNMSARHLLQRYFSDPEIFHFFDKLTSTYCYATVAEAPAILAAVMFVDNHVGGSWYPAGSTLFLPGKLEKVIEENGGDMLYGAEARSLVFRSGQPVGVMLDDGRTLEAPHIIYSGTVWNLYGKLIPPAEASRRRRAWAKKQLPTYPSVVLYATVARDAIPADAAPIELLVGNPEQLDESEVTAYILSIDDRTLCAEDEHTVVAIGPTFEPWLDLDEPTYRQRRNKEKDRLIAVLDKRFPGFHQKLRHAEVATPRSIERYTLKNGGAVAGPKQMLGQHMFRRLHTRTEWKNLLCCGESTVMGTGTPTVTVSGLSAANRLLRQLGREPYVFRKDMKQYVRTVEKPFTADRLYDACEGAERTIRLAALRCRFCEHPACTKGAPTDIPGILRRVAVGNDKGAWKCWQEAPVDEETLARFESGCVCVREEGTPVAIRGVIRFVGERNGHAGT